MLSSNEHIRNSQNFLQLESLTKIKRKFEGTPLKKFFSDFSDSPLKLKLFSSTLIAFLWNICRPLQ